MRLFIGLFFLVLTLPLLWLSQSQHRGEIFSSALRVESTQQQDGLVVVEGTPIVTNAPLCLSGDDATCLYTHTKVEEYKTTAFAQCGAVIQNSYTKLLAQVEDQCKDSGVCESCYSYEKTTWEVLRDEYAFADVALGAYTVKPSREATFIGTETFTDGQFPVTTAPSTEVSATVGDQRTRIEYLPKQDALLVAGNALDGFIGAADSDLFVLSNYGYGQTASELSRMDTSAQWSLAIGSLILMILGLVLVASQFVAPLTGVMRMLPFIGGPLNHGAQALVYVVVAIGASLIWLLCFAAVVLLKNIFIALALLAVIIIAVISLPRLLPEKIRVSLPKKRS